MKLKIWSEDVAKQEQDPKQLWVRLVADDESAIDLHVVDKTGKVIDNGIILVLEQDLKIIIICQNLAEAIPLKTNLYDEPIIANQSQVEQFLFRREGRLKFSDIKKAEAALCNAVDVNSQNNLH